MMTRRKRSPILVIGLGRFGGAVATELAALGAELVVMERDATLLGRYADLATLAVQADASDEQALRDIGADQVAQAVVAIGSDREHSILVTSLLSEMGVREIWAKAQTAMHGRVLSKVGATRVIFPEADMGTRVAHQVASHVSDYFEIGQNHAVMVVGPVDEMAGSTLQQLQLRRRYGITVTGVQHRDAGVDYATAETVIGSGDKLIIAGPIKNVHKFASRHG